VAPRAPRPAPFPRSSVKNVLRCLVVRTRVHLHVTTAAGVLAPHRYVSGWPQRIGLCRRVGIHRVHQRRRRTHVALEGTARRVLVVRTLRGLN
jgi:hypothetical protein